MTAYDNWLEEPYQTAAAEAERIEDEAEEAMTAIADALEELTAACPRHKNLIEQLQALVEGLDNLDLIEIADAM